STFGTDWFALDGELMPWSAKAQELLRRQYAAAGSAGRAALAEVNAVLAPVRAGSVSDGSVSLNAPVAHAPGSDELAALRDRVVAGTDRRRRRGDGGQAVRRAGKGPQGVVRPAGAEGPRAGVPADHLRPGLPGPGAPVAAAAAGGRVEAGAGDAGVRAGRRG